ncbi:MAG: Crp/Fnr family transcriptional regulator [Ignavibacteriae bacterium]|nr:Crp/Fnr family transcriptional regulator [Ignavibacteriota bacterium]
MRKSIESKYCEICNSTKKSIFKDFNSGDVEKLNLNKNCNFYKKGQVIFFEGNYPGGLFCIREGKVKVFKIGSTGKEQIIRFAKNGDALGYRALLVGETYSASASALEDSHICFIRKDTVFEIFKANNNFSFSLLKLLSRDLEDVENKMVKLAQKPVRDRLAEALLILKETYGMDKLGNINISLSREDFASIVGTATETVIRLLADFKKENLISTKGKKIKIINLNGLVQISRVND